MHFDEGKHSLYPDGERGTLFLYENSLFLASNEKLHTFTNKTENIDIVLISPLGLKAKCKNILKTKLMNYLHSGSIVFPIATQYTPQKRNLFFLPLSSTHKNVFETLGLSKNLIWIHVCVVSLKSALRESITQLLQTHQICLNLLE